MEGGSISWEGWSGVNCAMCHLPVQKDLSEHLHISPANKWLTEATKAWQEVRVNEAGRSTTGKFHSSPQSESQAVFIYVLINTSRDHRQLSTMLCSHQVFRKHGISWGLTITQTKTWKENTRQKHSHHSGQHVLMGMPMVCVPQFQHINTYILPKSSSVRRNSKKIRRQ